MADLPKSDSLAELQEYVWQINIERGFNTKDASKKMVMLMEEVGELAKAVRKHVGLKFTDTTQQQNIKEELADIQIVLLSLASMLGEDMFEAVIDKEKKKQNQNLEIDRKVGYNPYLITANRSFCDWMILSRSSRSSRCSFVCKSKLFF